MTIANIMGFAVVLLNLLFALIKLVKLIRREMIERRRRVGFGGVRGRGRGYGRGRGLLCLSGVGEDDHVDAEALETLI